MNAAIYALALNLSQASEDRALELLSLAVKENQFGAEYDANQRSQALNYLLKLLQEEHKQEELALKYADLV